jgi:hypothetical protein
MAGVPVWLILLLMAAALGGWVVYAQRQVCRHGPAYFADEVRELQEAFDAAKREVGAEMVSSLFDRWPMTRFKK